MKHVLANFDYSVLNVRVFAGNAFADVTFMRCAFKNMGEHVGIQLGRSGNLIKNAL